VDEQRPARRREDVQKGREAVERAGRGERVGCELEADRAAVERRLQGFGVGPDEAGGRPDREGPRERERALEPRHGELGRLVGRQPVDAEHGRGGDADQLVVAARRAQLRVMRRGIDRERRRANYLQRPAVEPRRAAARPQRRQERGRPEVLVEVGVHEQRWCAVNRFTEAVH
jgi:hypothetical protein